MSLMNIDAKMFNNILATTSRNILKTSYTMIKWDSSQDPRMVQYKQISKRKTPHKQYERQKLHDLTHRY